MGTYMMMCNYAYKLAKEKGYSFIHPFNDEDIATGQGTIAMEIFKDLPTVDIILAPVEGAVYWSGHLSQLNPNIKVTE